MNLDVTRGGLFVGLAIFGVIVYELRTVLDALGVSLPIVPYMAGVFVLAGVAVWIVVLNGGWRTEPDEAG
ncbi:CbaC protein [Halorubrum halodurans]|uniref:CbaC protein n=1 Tax=Halorubrum halodurans TaxID=1383851 RepID=A0A256ICC1_9EURY|nr:CbaC protein [Halorubrum halodurans]OYR53802.1 CbaC protein [Halorubrum halodurans]